MMIALLIKAGVVLTTLLVFYKLVLERESFYRLNRTFLLLGMVLTVTLPLITIPSIISNQGIIAQMIDSAIDSNKSLNPAFRNNTVNTQNAKLDPPDPGAVFSSGPVMRRDQNVEHAVSSDPSTMDTAQYSIPTNFISWIKAVYYFGLFIFCLRLMSQVCSILIKVRKSDDIIEDDGYKIINTPSIKEPCSFFNYIFINPELYDYDTYEQILAHELVHVRKRHSFDLVLSEVLVIVLWFYPLAWYYRKVVEMNIEYQTDDVVITDEQESKEKYQLNLINIATYSRPLTVMTNYNQSLIKQRILKMNAKKSNPHSAWKYTFIAPVILALMLILNKPNSLTAQLTKVQLNTDMDQTDIGSLEMIPEVLSPILTGTQEYVEESPSQGESLSSDTRSHDMNAAILPESKLSTQTSNRTTSMIADPSNCDALERATKMRAYNTVRDLLKAADLSCLEDNEKGASKDLVLAREMLKNGADLNIANGGRRIEVEGGYEHFSWGQSILPPACSEIRRAAFFGTIAEVKRLLKEYDDDCIIDEDGGPNDMIYIKELLRVNADIQLKANGDFKIGGVNVVIDFDEYKTQDNSDSEDQSTIGENRVSGDFYASDDFNSPSSFDENSIKGLSWIPNTKNLINAIRDKNVIKVRVLVEEVMPNSTHVFDDSYGEDDEGGEAVILRVSRCPLSAAARCGKVGIAKILIDAGAEVEFYSEGDEAPLMAAATSGHLDMVKYLVDQGADIHKEHDGHGPAKPILFIYGDSNVPEYLDYLRRGAPLAVKPAGKGTALQAAQNQKHHDIVDYLISKGAK